MNKINITTNLKKIKEIAIHFLHTDPIEDSIGFVIHHPFFNSPILPYPLGNFELFDYRDNEKYKKWQIYMENQINKVKNVYEILAMMNHPYYMNFYEFIEEYISLEDKSNLLRECWILTEFPHKDVSKAKIRQWFINAGKNVSNDIELKAINEMPNTITIYRGQASKNKYNNELSWTLSKDKAIWFATRWNNKGLLYKAELDKKDIFAYITDRNEDEIVVDYRKLKNVEKIDYNNEISKEQYEI